MRKSNRVERAQTSGAIYARYSTSDQKETSVEDQIRRCREIAGRINIVITDEHLYADAAISGADKSRDKRKSFDALLAAIEDERIDVVVVDELSRLGRDVLELAKFDRLARQHRVRIITADGLDSSHSTWDLHLSIMSGIAQHNLKETRHRVKRGMHGQLERGHMIACPPFGYEAVKVINSQKEAIGTDWKIIPVQAEIVKEVFKRRSEGQSAIQIAKALNEKCVALKKRKGSRGVGGWQPASILRMLQNQIYKGTFVYRGSATYEKNAMEAGDEVDEPIMYSRPHLRIVSNDLWDLCNKEGVSRSHRGGGRHLLAGLVNCGDCGAVVVVNSPTRNTRSLCCAVCNSEKMVGSRESTIGYMSVRGVEFLLETLLCDALTPEMITLFRDRLRARLLAGPEADIKKASEEVARAEAKLQRLAEALGQLGDDDNFLLHAYRKAKDSWEASRQYLTEVQAGLAAVDTVAIEQQLAVDPREIIPLLFHADVSAVEKKRAILTRLFPSIVMLGRDSTGGMLFDIDMIPGSAFASVGDTPLVEDEVIRYRVRLGSSARRPTVWSVDYLALPQTEHERKLPAFA